MAGSILQLVPLDGPPWPTVDPFLFCVHHVDAYPAGNGRSGPAGSLEGRTVGQDFAGIDGWRMYHGAEVPGFPQHPHRGFETVTYVRRGLVDHTDSLGATARYGGGDVQWLTAGAGIVHAETFPLVDPDGPNPLELFQIWVNLAAEDKMADPHFAMLWDTDIPRLRTTDDEGRTVEVTVIAGLLGGRVPPAPPPRSWAARADAEVAIWHARLDGGARWTMPAAADDRTVRTLYVAAGDGVMIDDEAMPAGHGAVVRTDVAVEVVGAAGGAEVLVLGGRPIAEPVARYGPFVMNDDREIEEAFADYRRTGFGGWPWPSDEPVHAGSPGRFARRPDGVVEEPASSSTG